VASALERLMVEADQGRPARVAPLVLAATLVCAVIAPRWGILLAGVGFLVHGVWDACHFRAKKVVHRSYAEFCGVVDLVVGTALIVAALV